MANIQPFLQHDAFAQHVGIELLEVSPGKAKARLKIQEAHFNGLKTVHGAVIFALADFVFAAAANAREGLAVAINVNISYVKAATEGSLFAETEENSLNRNSRIILYESRMSMKSLSQFFKEWCTENADEIRSYSPRRRIKN